MDWTMWDFEIQPYPVVESKMLAFVTQKPSQPELWYGEHFLCTTLGVRSYDQHIGSPTLLPTYRASRGGYASLHLPGQLVFYPLMPVVFPLTIATYVRLLEETVIRTLRSFGLRGTRQTGLPGVYTELGKICSVGLRVKQNWSYHGLSLNIACPLLPTKWLIHCGNPSLTITSIGEHQCYPSIKAIKKLMVTNFFDALQELVDDNKNS